MPLMSINAPEPIMEIAWVILTIEAAGYPKGRFAAPVAGDVELKLRRDVRPIAGVAVDSDGKPVAGEMVILITWKEAGPMSVFTMGAKTAEFAPNSVARDFAATDAEGRFEFPTVIESAAYSLMLARRKGAVVVMNGIQDLGAEARGNLRLAAGE